MECLSGMANQRYAIFNLISQFRIEIKSRFPSDEFRLSKYTEGNFNQKARRANFFKFIQSTLESSARRDHVQFFFFLRFTSDPRKKYTSL